MSKATKATKATNATNEIDKIDKIDKIDNIETPETPDAGIQPQDMDQLAAGSVTKVQLTTFGRFMGWDGEKDVEQLIDSVAAQNVLDELAGAPRELLVDRDHSSERETLDRDTTAMAWADNVVAEADGLYADFTWTDAGATLVKSREYRFVSPVWVLDSTGRPVKLMRIGLTNRPAILSKPILNSEGTTPEERDMLEATKADQENREVDQPADRKEDMDKEALAKLIEQLKLDPAATLEDVYAAIDSLIKSVADAEAEKVVAEADAVIDANKDVIVNSDGFRQAYITDKDLCMAVLNSIGRKEKATVMTDTTTTTTPEVKTEVKTVVNTDAARKPDKSPRVLDQFTKIKDPDAKLAFARLHKSELVDEMGQQA